MHEKNRSMTLFGGSVAIVLVLLGLGFYFIVLPMIRPGGTPATNTQPASVGGERAVIVVEATYPGANAQTVADSVAAPIELQLLGLEKGAHFTSCCRGDGTCRVHITLEPNADLNQTEAEVQNRLALAAAHLPEDVQRAGIRVKKKWPYPAVLVTLSSPDGTRDVQYLSKYADTTLREQFAGVRQTGDVVLSKAKWNGKPVAMLALHAQRASSEAGFSGDVRAKVEGHRPNLPEHLQLDVAYDASRPMPAVVVEVELPSGASPHRYEESLRRAADVVRQIDGVQQVLTSTVPIFPQHTHACLLVLLAADRKKDRQQIASAIGEQLQKLIPESVCRVCDPTGVGNGLLGSYPIEAGIYGPDSDKVLSLGRLLAETLRMKKELADVWTDADTRPEPRQVLEVDRAAAKTMGVALSEITKALQALDVDLSLKEMPPLERTWQFAGDIFRRGTDILKTVTIRNDKGDFIPLNKLAKLRDESAFPRIERFNALPMTPLTANLTTGVALNDGWATCEAEFTEARKQLGLGEEYKLVRLRK